MSPHERPVPGPAADFAAMLGARLPLIETPRLRLRAPALADFPLWAEILTGPAGPWLGGPFTRDAAFTEFAAAVGTWLLRGHGPWTVETRRGETRAGETVGFVLIGFEPGDREPELGFLFAKAAEGQGYAAEAARAARAHAFGPLALPTLVSCIDEGNTRSIRLAERLGARRESPGIWRHQPEAQA